MKIKFGTTLTTFSRTLAVGIALTINAIASLILVRKLPVADYALYQAVIKRLTGFTNIPFTLTSFWIYRYMVQKRKGTWEASLILVLVAALLGFSIGFFFTLSKGFSLMIAILAGLALLSFESFRPINTSIDALRPVRFGLLQLIYRALYSTLIFLLVYVMAEKIVGAFVSVIIAFLATSAIGFLWLRDFLPPPGNPFHILKEWVKGSYLTLVSTLSTLVMSFDVIVAYKFLGSLGVAAFFASFVFFSYLREPLLHGLRYLQGYLLSGGAPERTLRSLKATIIFLSPILVYFMFNSEHIIYLLNPKYVFASKAIIVLAIDTYIFVLFASISNIYAGLIKGNAEETARKLIKLELILFAFSLFYIFFIFLTLSRTKLVEKGVMFWAFSKLILDMLYLATYIITFPDSKLKNSIAREVFYNSIYFVGALPLGYVIRAHGTPSPHFFRELFIILPSFSILLTIYYVSIILISKEIRRSLKSLIGDILRLRRG